MAYTERTESTEDLLFFTGYFNLRKKLILGSSYIYQ